MEWSKEQLDVIQSRTNNTLVSASAGSGKTSVMIERLMRIVTGDYFVSEPTPIKRVVVVTFNNSVAQELRLKIAKKLKEIMSKGEYISYLREQIEDIPMSDISTLHALCGNIIRQNFEVIGVDPAFGILDEEGRTILFDKALDSTLKEYQSNYNADFEVFYKYCGAFNFTKIIKKFYDFVVAQRDRDKFLQETVFKCCPDDIDNDELVTHYVRKINAEIEKTIQIYEEQVYTLSRNGVDSLAEHAESVLSQFKAIGHFDKLSSMLAALPATVTFKRMPTIQKKKADELTLELKEQYQAVTDNAKKLTKTIESLKVRTFEEYSLTSKECTTYVTILRDFVESVMQKFKELKLQENKMDFNDLEYYTVKILEDDEVAKSIREKYDFVCVDEYQDINAVQEYILTRISSGNNLFMVGDSKQSIYGFRQTDTGIFLEKFDEYIADNTKGKPFYLNANYRSSNEVLQFVNLIFDQIMTKDFGGVDYKHTARLEFGQEAYFRTVDKPCRVAIFSKEGKDEEELRKVNNMSAISTNTVRKEGGILDEDHIYSVQNHPIDELGKVVDKEAAYIAQQISELVGIKRICEVVDGKGVERLIEYGDIAILFASRDKKVTTIVKTLHDLGIPVDLSIVEKESENISVEILIDYLRVIDNPHQDYALISAMSGFLGGFTFDELATIREQATPLITKHSNDTYFYEYVLQLKEVDSELGRKVKSFFDRLEQYRILQASLTVSELMKNIVASTHFDDYILMKEDGKQELEQMMLYIRSLKDKNYNDSLSDYLKMVTDRQKIAQTSTGGEQNCVKLQTMHSSKGLEYPIVFVVNAAKAFNFDDQRQKFVFDKYYGVSMHGVDTVNNLEVDNINMIALKDYKKQELIQEKMRIFYVALTRAKNILYVTATVNDSDNLKNIIDPCKANSYLDWILYTNHANQAFGREYFVDENAADVENDIFTASSLYFNMPTQEKIEELESNIRFQYDFEEAKNLCIKHTVTEINNIASQSVQSDFEMTQELVVSKGDKTQIGTALHKAMELVDLALDGEEEVGEWLDNMVEGDLMSKAQRQLVDDSLIAECLTNPIVRLARTHKHYREKEFMLNIPACEVLDGVKTDDKILLQGVIDLLIEQDNGYIVVDFKYTRKSDEAIIQSYQKQLDIYALAVESCTGKKVLGKYIVVIGDNRVVEIK